MRESSSSRTRWRLAWSVIAMTAMLVSLTPAATYANTAPTAEVPTQENPDRQMPTVALDDTGYEALVNTLGLRSAKKKFAGMYVTIAEDRHRLQTGVANQLYTELGVFRDTPYRFKLLGVDGKWVKLKHHQPTDLYRTGTWANSWEKAWSFRVVRPTQSAMTPGVESALLAADIDPRQPVCVKAFGSKGAYRGLLGVTNGGKMVLKPNAKCGKATATLFMTDTVPTGVSPNSVPNGVEVDKLTYTKYVAPDLPPDGLDDDVLRRLMRDEIRDYVGTLRDFNDAVKSDVADDVSAITFRLLTESYEIPGEEAEDLNIADFLVDQTSTLLAFIPKYGEVASAALQIIYDSVSLGVAIVHNQNLEGPRVVEGVNNEVLTTASDIMTDYDVAFFKIGSTIDALADLLLEDCASAANCTSDRRLKAWFDAEPNADLPTQIELAKQQTVASHELVVWKRLLPIRAMLYQPDAWFSMVGQAGGANCNPGYPYNTGYNNEDILGRYEIWAEAAPEQDTWGEPLAVTHLYAPYHNWYKPAWCAGKKVNRPYISAWTLGLANDDEAAVTPVTGTWRLFDSWDPAEPITSGFGLSKTEVACEWLDNDARGYMGRGGGYFNPCHFAFYGPDGSLENPYEDEANTNYADAAAWAAAYWIPSKAETDEGRPVIDPDVVSPAVPRLEFAACDSGVKSVDGGAQVTVYFTNLYDGPIDVHWINKNGTLSKDPAVSMVRQDQLNRPFAGDRANGPFVLVYSDAIPTTVGTAFQAVNEAGECLGIWSVPPMPADPAVPYAVVEVHGDHGILARL